MNDLDSIINKVAAGGRVIVEWTKLINFFFRGENPEHDIRKWAEDNDMTVIFRCREESLRSRVVQEESLTGGIIEDVTFLPKKVRSR